MKIILCCLLAFVVSCVDSPDVGDPVQSSQSPSRLDAACGPMPPVPVSATLVSVDAINNTAKMTAEEWKDIIAWMTSVLKWHSCATSVAGDFR